MTFDEVGAPAHLSDLPSAYSALVNSSSVLGHI